MSKIALEGNSLGSGTFTVAAPNSNSNYTLTLPTSTGTVVVTGGAQTIEFAAGTVSAPSITTTGDTNTGIFFPAADTIAFTEGGVEAMRIDSSGNVLFGTGASATTIGGVAAAASGATDKNLTISAWYPTSGTNEYGGDLILAAGRPTGNGSGVSGSVYIRVGKSTTSGSGLGSVIDAITANESTLTFKTADTERLRIDSSGNVGIGTTSPSSYFSGGTNLVIGNASGNTGMTISSGNASLGRILFADGTSGAEAYQGWVYYTHADNAMSFATAGSERARITSGGYFKASNDGTYAGITGSYHEVKQSANDYTFISWGTNASLTNSIQEVYATRSATSAYTFINVYSNVGGGSDREFQFRGDGNAYADGTFNNNGADYAEFFESATGAALTLGATVVLDGNKVREATEQDPTSAIIGVVRPKEPSKASMVVGNTAWNKWANKYLTDDFDRYIMEDHDVVEWEETITDEEGKTSTKQHSYESHNIPAGVTVPADAIRKTHDEKGNKFQHYKLNPAWDKDAEYVNRENRPEWNIIGLVGQVKVLKGQPVNERWVKMRDVSASVEEWFIR